jgi:hypothetical protein
VPRGQPTEPVDEGDASLTDEGLRVGDTLIPMAELHAVSVEVQNRLTFRRGEVLFELIPEGSSTLKWGHFLTRKLA